MPKSTVKEWRSDEAQDPQNATLQRLFTISLSLEPYALPSCGPHLRSSAPARGLHVLDQFESYRQSIGIFIKHSDRGSGEPCDEPHPQGAHRQGFRQRN